MTTPTTVPDDDVRESAADSDPAGSRGRTSAREKKPSRRRFGRKRDLDSIASAPRRKRRRRIIGAILALMVVAGVVWLVWFSSLLTVTQVRVVGLEELPGGGSAAVDQVLAAAAIPTGIALARLDTDAAAARVHELGWVADGEVRRGWPHEAVIAVTPRIAVAALANSPGSGVDADGVAFDVGLSAGSLKGLPAVTAEGDALRESMLVLESLPPDLTAKVQAIAAPTKDSVELSLRSGHLVRWGSSERAAEKIAVLRALMEHRGDVFDVSAPGAPTVYRK